MGCGCGQPVKLGIDADIFLDSWTRRNRNARDNAAMCHLCPHAEHAPNAFVSGAVACTIGGKIMVECPLKIFDSGPVKHWAGINWYGVPMPHRILLWAFHPKHPRPSSFSSCGCLVWLKNWYNKHWKRQGSAAV